MSRHRYTLLDVFTSERLSGNAHAVVHDADAIDSEVMQRFARETRLSETSFVQSPAAGGHYRHRIFMPTHEIPFAGHPSLGTAVAVARERGKREVTYEQETDAGRQPIDVELDGERAHASMLQEPPQFGDELDPEAVLGAVGLEGSEADPALPVQLVSTGVWQILACVRDPAALGRVFPDYGAIGHLLAPTASLILYVAHVDPSSGRVSARGFAGSTAVGEDPATGSAAGPLQAHVHARLGLERLEITQGVEIGRRSVMRTAIEGDRVRVGGDVVVVIDGHVHLDT
ncbi:MAG: trans-2,3-dihydro-3-hydroxyanthranilate isomerase [Solirubrobacteraceae bacterium]|nr:trans-2,3-dihydro-3-hydroxyanthranilate isomerase [Solirubrobacteraceae bacterium]